MPAELVITRGYPGSGKSTWAQNWVSAAPDRVRVNRDDIRQQMFGRPVLSSKHEGAVTVAQHSQVRALLRAGWSVVVDDTNLEYRHARAYADIAEEVGGVPFRCVDFVIDPATCKERAEKRRKAEGRDVPDSVIDRMAQRHPVQSWKPVEPRDTTLSTLEPYANNAMLPECIIADLDGTLALHQGRSPYDETRVGEDEPRWSLVYLIDGYLADGGRKIMFFSGRTEACREDTEKWLRNFISDKADWELHMRGVADTRKDITVKYEMFDSVIRDQYQVLAIFDDRLQVCRMWERLVPNALFRVGDPESDF